MGLAVGAEVLINTLNEEVGSMVPSVGLILGFIAVASLGLADGALVVEGRSVKGLVGAVN